MDKAITSAQQISANLISELDNIKKDVDSDKSSVEIENKVYRKSIEKDLRISGTREQINVDVYLSNKSLRIEQFKEWYQSYKVSDNPKYRKLDKGILINSLKTDFVLINVNELNSMVKKIEMYEKIGTDFDRKMRSVLSDDTINILPYYSEFLNLCMNYSSRFTKALIQNTMFINKKQIDNFNNNANIKSDIRDNAEYNIKDKI